LKDSKHISNRQVLALFGMVALTYLAIFLFGVLASILLFLSVGFLALSWRLGFLEQAWLELREEYLGDGRTFRATINRAITAAKRDIQRGLTGD
jgi:hypothetical protein